MSAGKMDPIISVMDKKKDNERTLKSPHTADQLLSLCLVFGAIVLLIIETQSHRGHVM